MIDNYDSFTFNLVHYFETLGQKVKVVRNDDINLAEIETMAPEYIVISPGPGTPNQAGISLAIIAKFAGKIPLLGVCLGHQCIAQHFGAKIKKAKRVMHGKTCYINHDQQGVFSTLNHPLQVTRYHSLIVDPASLPEELTITAWSCDQTGKKEEIMALQHKHLPLVSVQFHPEAILTEQGQVLLENFINLYNN